MLALVRDLHEQSPTLCCSASLCGCTELCDAVPEADYLNLHGLKCSRKDVISNASILHDGAYWADWKAVVSAEWSCGLQHRAKVLRLEEEPSRMVLSLKPVCCEAAAELIRNFLPSSWPWQLISAPSPHLCQLHPCGHAVCCVLQVPRLSLWVAARPWEASVTVGPLCGTAHI